METFDRWEKFAAKLGMERKAKHLDPMDAVRAAVEEANRK
jgi:hypothetical protein